MMSSRCSSHARGDALEHHPPARHALARLGREVGAGVERHAVGREEGVQRPAAVAGHGLHGVHVDGVDVRALLAVDLDRHEVLVHQLRHRGVLERLALHHVAPVAGRVADRDEQRLLLVARAGQRLLAPRVPVDGVVLVLEEVGGGLVGEAVHGHVGCLSMSHHRETVTADPGPPAAGPIPTPSSPTASSSSPARRPVDPDTGQLVERLDRRPDAPLPRQPGDRGRGRRRGAGRRRARRHLRHRHLDLQGRQRGLRHLLRRATRRRAARSASRRCRSGPRSRSTWCWRCPTDGRRDRRRRRRGAPRRGDDRAADADPLHAHDLRARRRHRWR